MKSLLFLVALITMVGQAQSQNWQPFHPQTQYFYAACDNHQAPAYCPYEPPTPTIPMAYQLPHGGYEGTWWSCGYTSVSLYDRPAVIDGASRSVYNLQVIIDSTYSLGTDTSYLFREELVYFGNEFPAIVGSDSARFIRNKSNVLLGGFTKTANGEIYFFNDQGDTNHIKPLASIGTTWMFNDTASASILYYDTMQIKLKDAVFTDSVKQIAVVDTASLDTSVTVTISKNHGIISMVGYLNTAFEHHLTGLNQAGQLSGVTPLKDTSIFNFNVGDVFQYIGYSAYAGDCTAQTTKETVVGKQYKQDTVVYTIRVQGLGGGSQNPGMHPYTVFKTLEVYHDTTSRVNESLGRLLHNNIGDKNLVREWTNANSNYKGHYKEIGLVDVFSEMPSFANGYIGHFPPYGIGRASVYAKGLGVVLDLFGALALSEKKMIGYIKGQDTVGTIHPDWLFTRTYEPQAIQLTEEKVEVYPNPTQGQLNVAFTQPTKMKTRLILSSISGQIVLEKLIDGGTYQTTLDLGNLPKGMYILRAQNEHWRYQKKVIIQ